MNSLLPGSRRVLFLLIMLGWILRMMHGWSLSLTAFPEIPRYFSQSDMHFFWTWSGSILEGDLLGRDTPHPHTDYMSRIASLETWHRWWGGKEVFQQAPLYPYLLALLRWLLGDSLLRILLVQLILGAFQPWIMFHLARRAVDERTGLAAAALSALYGPLLFYQGTLLRDWIPALLEPFALVLVLKASETSHKKHWLLAGLMLGFAVLAKERVLLFVPLVCLWIFWKHRERKPVRSCGLLLAGVIVALLPLIARNLVVGVSPLALSNRGAEFFIEGNAADAFPIGLRVPDSMEGILKRSDGEFAAVVRETLKTYQGDWIRFLQLQMLKFRALLDPLEVPNNLNFYYGVEISKALSFTVGYGFLLPTAVLGLALSVRSRRYAPLLLLYGAVIFFGLMMSNISSRQRLGLVPVLTVYAAAAIVWWWDALRAKDFRQATVAALVVVATASVQQFLFPVKELRSNITYAVHPPEYLISAHIYARNGEFDRAVDEIVRLRLKLQKRVPEATDVSKQIGILEVGYLNQWADQLEKQGRHQEAVTVRNEAKRILGKN